MIQSLFNTLFGCSHQRTTFPMTPSRKNTGSVARNGMYITCLDCGKEFDYDWKSMRVGQQVVDRSGAVTTQPSFR